MYACKERSVDVLLLLLLLLLLLWGAAAQRLHCSGLEGHLFVFAAAAAVFVFASLFVF